MTKIASSAKRIEAFIESPETYRNFITEPPKVLDKWMRQRDMNPAMVSVQVGWMALWYGRKAALNRYKDGPEEGDIASFCRYKALEDYLLFQDTQVRKSGYKVHEICITLLACLAESRWEEYDRLKPIFSSLFGQRIYETDVFSIPLARYTRRLIQVYELHQSNVDARELLGEEPADFWAHPYGMFLLAIVERSVQTEHVDEICRYHISQCRECTNSQNYDFAEETYHLYPPEILAGLRAMSACGLPVPPSTHPLMQLPPVQHFPGTVIEVSDPFYDRLWNAVSQVILQ